MIKVICIDSHGLVSLELLCPSGAEHWFAASFLGVLLCSLPRGRRPSCWCSPAASAAPAPGALCVPPSWQRWRFPHNNFPASFCSLLPPSNSAIPGLCPTRQGSLTAPLGTSHRTCSWCPQPSDSPQGCLCSLSCSLKDLEQHLALWEERRSPWQLARQEDCARNLIFFFPLTENASIFDKRPF